MATRARRHAALALVGLLAACVGVNPDWDPPGRADELGLGASTDTSEDETGDSGETGESDTAALEPDLGAGPSCGESAAPEGPCPPECDACVDGMCVRTCLESECEKDVIVSPEGWGMHLRCAETDACKDAVIVCVGPRRCEIDCAGDKACEHAMVTCGSGPCDIQCEPGFDKPCDRLEVECGSNTTTLSCEDEAKAGNPTLLESGGECACVDDCQPADD